MTEENHDTTSQAAGENAGAVEATSAARIPRPPQSRPSRKRPCAKQGGRRQENRAGRDPSADRNPAQRRPAERKLNRYALDVYTGLIRSVRHGEEIAAGSRVVEQPAGHAKPSINAFYDASLLPAGSTLVAHWGLDAPELDPQLVARLGRLAKLAGYGDQARRTMFDQLARSANPAAALEAVIVELGGADALTAAPGELTTTMTREQLAEVVTRGVNVGNEKLVELAENLPAALAPEDALREHLTDLPGMIEDLEADGNGSVLRVRGYRFEDKAAICERLRAAGGRQIDVVNTRVDKDGKKVKAYIVSARFNVAPIELAAARTGRDARVHYRVTEDGTVTGSYRADLYGRTIATPDIPCTPSWASVETLVRELERRGDTATVELLGDLDAGLEDPISGLAGVIGPVRTLTEASARIAALTADDVLGEGYSARLADASTEIRATDGRRIPVEYRGGAAVLAEFTLHPADLRPGSVPETVEGTDGATPTKMRRVRFETKKGSNRPRVVVEEVEVSELRERRQRFLDGKDPKEAVLIEVRENFMAEATRSMVTTLTDPPESLKAARNPEAVAKSRVLSKHLDPYAAAGGDLVHLVEVIATAQGETAWSRWCRDNVKAFRDDARRRRQQHLEPATDFFAALGLGDQAQDLLREAAAGLLSERLGREVDADEAVRIAQECRVTKEHAYNAVDRGRALAAFVGRSRGPASTRSPERDKD